MPQVALCQSEKIGLCQHRRTKGIASLTRNGFRSLLCAPYSYEGILNLSFYSNQTSSPAALNIGGPSSICIYNITNDGECQERALTKYLKNGEVPLRPPTTGLSILALRVLSVPMPGFVDLELFAEVVWPRQFHS